MKRSSVIEKPVANAGKGSFRLQSAVLHVRHLFFFLFPLNKVRLMSFTCDSLRCVFVCYIIIYAASHSRCE